MKFNAKAVYLADGTHATGNNTALIASKTIHLEVYPQDQVVLAIHKSPKGPVTKTLIPFSNIKSISLPSDSKFGDIVIELPLEPQKAGHVKK